MPCQGDAGCQAQRPADVVIPFPDDAKEPPQPVTAQTRHQAWHTPLTLTELARTMDQNRNKKLRLLHGNTSYGIYKEEYLESEVLVDIRLIPELYAEPKVRKGALHVGSAISYSDLITAIEAELKDKDLPVSSRLWATNFMARRTAGRIVRNAASLGGNTMLVLKHIASGTGEHRHDLAPENIHQVVVGERLVEHVPFLEQSLGRARLVADMIEHHGGNFILSRRAEALLHRFGQIFLPGPDEDMAAPIKPAVLKPVQTL